MFWPANIHANPLNILVHLQLLWLYNAYLFNVLGYLLPFVRNFTVNLRPLFDFNTHYRPILHRLATIHNATETDDRRSDQNRPHMPYIKWPKNYEPGRVRYKFWRIPKALCPRYIDIFIVLLEGYYEIIKRLSFLVWLQQQLFQDAQVQFEAHNEFVSKCSKLTSLIESCSQQLDAIGISSSADCDFLRKSINRIQVTNFLKPVNLHRCIIFAAWRRNSF